MMALAFAGPGTKLSPGDIDREAAAIGAKPPALRMFLDTESRGSGFLPDKRPVILPERHIFSRETNHRFDAAHPDISSSTPGGYGQAGGHQYDRLAAMIRLNRTAALCATSWGLGQVLGTNFKMVGFADPEAFVAAMVESEDKQLEAMLAYLKAANLVRYLQTSPPNYTRLAAGYNGTGQVERYAGVLKANYEKEVRAAASHPAPAAPSLNDPEPVSRATHPVDFHAPAAVVDIRDVQKRLNDWGIDPVLKIDGALGPDTRDAIEVFQQDVKLPVTGHPDDATLAALTAATKDPAATA